MIVIAGANGVSAGSSTWAMIVTDNKSTKNLG